MAMSDKHQPLSDEERENLVAFLDGELQGEAAREVEAKLSLDPRYRAEAEILRQTWQMLDFLPRAEAPAHFSQQTVSRISALRPAVAAPPRAGRRRPWAVGIGWVAAILLAGVGGFAGMNALNPRDTTDEELSHDLRVIENRRYFEPIDNIDFLWQLDQPDLFGDDAGG